MGLSYAAPMVVGPSAHHDDAVLTDLVERARAGDRQAWDALCERIKRVAWKRINTFGLSRADAEDAFAATLCRLAEHLHRIREPQKLPGWVATTARNEVLAIFRTQRKDVPSELVGDEPALDAPLDERLLDDELLGRVRAAFGRLGPKCRDLLERLTLDPPPSYQQLSADLGVPIGSIGPTRLRCLDELRSYLREAP